MICNANAIGRKPSTILPIFGRSFEAEPYQHFPRERPAVSLGIISRDTRACAEDMKRLSWRWFNGDVRMLPGRQNVRRLCLCSRLLKGTFEMRP